MAKTTIPISGMHCVSCALNIENILRKEKGVVQAAVNYASGKAYIDYDESAITVKQL